MQFDDVLETDDVEVAGECQQQCTDGGTNKQAGDRQQVGGIARRNHSVEDEFVGHWGEHTEQHDHKGTDDKQQGVGTRYDFPRKVEEVFQA